MSMRTTQTSGIQTLMEAEKEAKQIVSAAREEKVRRLKQARDEAEREIDQLKAQKEAEFQQNLAHNVGSSDDATRQLDGETTQKIQLIQQAYGQNKNAVIAKLLEAIQTVDTKPHMNARVGA